jgi:hypothetical protein
MTATRQLAIILAFVALGEMNFEQMATVSEKRPDYKFVYFNLRFEMFLVSLFSWIAKLIQNLNFCLFFILF